MKYISEKQKEKEGHINELIQKTNKMEKVIEDIFSLLSYLSKKIDDNSSVIEKRISALEARISVIAKKVGIVPEKNQEA